MSGNTRGSAVGSQNHGGCMAAPRLLAFVAMMSSLTTITAFMEVPPLFPSCHQALKPTVSWRRFLPVSPKRYTLHSPLSTTTSTTSASSRQMYTGNTRDYDKNSHNELSMAAKGKVDDDEDIATSLKDLLEEVVMVYMECTRRYSHSNNEETQAALQPIQVTIQSLIQDMSLAMYHSDDSIMSGMKHQEGFDEYEERMEMAQHVAETLGLYSLAVRLGGEFECADVEDILAEDQKDVKGLDDEEENQNQSVESFRQRLETVKSQLAKMDAPTSDVKEEEKSSKTTRVIYPTRPVFQDNDKPDVGQLTELLDRATTLLADSLSLESSIQKEARDLVKNVGHLLYYTKKESELDSSSQRTRVQIAEDLDTALQLHLKLGDELSEEILKELVAEYIASENLPIPSSSKEKTSDLQRERATVRVRVSGSSMTASLQETLEGLQSLVNSKKISTKEEIVPPIGMAEKGDTAPEAAFETKTKQGEALETEIESTSDVTASKESLVSSLPEEGESDDSTIKSDLGAKTLDSEMLSMSEEMDEIVKEVATEADETSTSKTEKMEQDKADMTGPSEEEIDRQVQEALEEAESALAFAEKQVDYQEASREKIINKVAGMAFDMTFKGAFGLVDRIKNLTSKYDTGAENPADATKKSSATKPVKSEASPREPFMVNENQFSEEKKAKDLTRDTVVKSTLQAGGSVRQASNLPFFAATKVVKTTSTPLKPKAPSAATVPASTTLSSNSADKFSPPVRSENVGKDDGEAISGEPSSISSSTPVTERTDDDITEPALDEVERDGTDTAPESLSGALKEEPSVGSETTVEDKVVPDWIKNKKDGAADEEATIAARQKKELTARELLKAQLAMNMKARQDKPGKVGVSLSQKGVMDEMEESKEDEDPEAILGGETANLSLEDKVVPDWIKNKKEGAGTGAALEADEEEAAVDVGLSDKGVLDEVKREEESKEVVDSEAKLDADSQVTDVSEGSKIDGKAPDMSTEDKVVPDWVKNKRDGADVKAELEADEEKAAVAARRKEELAARELLKARFAMNKKKAQQDNRRKEELAARELLKARLAINMKAQQDKSGKVGVSLSQKGVLDEIKREEETEEIVDSKAIFGEATDVAMEEKVVPYWIKNKKDDADVAAELEADEEDAAVDVNLSEKGVLDEIKREEDALNMVYSTLQQTVTPGQDEVDADASLNAGLRESIASDDIDEEDEMDTLKEYLQEDNVEEMVGLDLEDAQEADSQEALSGTSSQEKEEAAIDTMDSPLRGFLALDQTISEKKDLETKAVVNEEEDLYAKYAFDEEEEDLYAKYAVPPENSGAPSFPSSQGVDAQPQQKNQVDPVEAAGSANANRMRGNNAPRVFPPNEVVESAPWDRVAFDPSSNPVSKPEKKTPVINKIDAAPGSIWGGNRQQEETTKKAAATPLSPDNYQTDTAPTQNSGPWGEQKPNPAKQGGPADATRGFESRSDPAPRAVTSSGTPFNTGREAVQKQPGFSSQMPDTEKGVSTPSEETGHFSPPPRSFQPPQSVQPPVEMGQDPGQPLEPPVRSEQAPFQPLESPTQSEQSPISNVEPPVQSEEPPVQSVEPPVQPMEPPMESPQPPPPKRPVLRPLAPDNMGVAQPPPRKKPAWRTISPDTNDISFF